MTKQLILDLNHKNFADDFILHEENLEVYKILEKFFGESDFRKLHPSLMVVGSKFCGKTAILSEFSKKNQIIFLDNLQINFLENQIYVLENIEKIENEDELFHLINSSLAAKSFLIFTSLKIPNFKLKDLNSRLKNFYHISFKKLTLEFAKILLAHKFAQMQIRISEDVLDFLSEKCEEYKDVESIFKKMKNYLLESSKKISVKELKKIDW